MSASHQWRRRRSAAPLSLAIVDHDTKRFTFEGTVGCEEPWVTEIFRANQAGRNIEFSIMEIDKINTEFSTHLSARGYDQWPPRSIIWF